MKTNKFLGLVLCILLISSVTAFASVPTVKEPITITIWHTRAAGANGEQMDQGIERFNATNPYGITVEGVYQGGYVATLAKVMQSLAAGTNPEVVLLERAAGVPVMATQGVLLDMTPYAERDNFDLSNVPPVLLDYAYYNDQLISMPYIRSTPLYYYNKGLMAEAGFDKAPETIEELIEASRAMTKVVDGRTEVYGFGLLNDPGWFIQNMLYQMGSNLVSDDGLSTPSLEDGTMLKALTAWRDWVDEGWCVPPTVTDQNSVMQDMFHQGKLGGLFYSSAGLTNILSKGRNAGVEIGVAYIPTWDIDRPSAPVGGGQVAIVQRGKDEQQMAAAWEFVKFLMSDEEVASNSAYTGYLPATYGSVETDIIQELWEKTPEYRVPFDQLEFAQELPWSEFNSEYIEQFKVVCSQLIIDRTITPEEAVEALKREASIIFW